VTPQERQRQRSLIALALRASLLPLLRMGMRPRPSRDEWAQMVEAAYPAVYRARMDYWRLAERAYREERQRVTGQSGPIVFPRRNYPPEALDKGLREAVKHRLDALAEGIQAVLDRFPQALVECLRC
jgi:hypothetical protein